jgi:hypothetical protein
MSLIKIVKELDKIHPWMFVYLANQITKKKKNRRKELTNIVLSVCDHFEPLRNKVSYKEGLEKVENGLIVIL